MKKRLFWEFGWNTFGYFPATTEHLFPTWTMAHLKLTAFTLDFKTLPQHFLFIYFLLFRFHLQTDQSIIPASHMTLKKFYPSKILAFPCFIVVSQIDLSLLWIKNKKSQKLAGLNFETTKNLYRLHGIKITAILIYFLFFFNYQKINKQATLNCLLVDSIQDVYRQRIHQRFTYNHEFSHGITCHRGPRIVMPVGAALVYINNYIKYTTRTRNMPVTLKVLK